MKKFTAVVVVVLALMLPGNTGAAGIDGHALKPLAATQNQPITMTGESKFKQAETSDAPQTMQRNEIKFFGKRIHMKTAMVIWIIIFLSAISLSALLFYMSRARRGKDKKLKEVKKKSLV